MLSRQGEKKTWELKDQKYEFVLNLYKFVVAKQRNESRKKKQRNKFTYTKIVTRNTQI